MRNVHLFHRAMLVLAFVAVCGCGFSQTAKEKKARERRKGDNSFWLNMKGQLGNAKCFDKSTVPFAYSGFSRGLNVGFTDEWKRCHVQFDFDWLKTKLSGPAGEMNYFSPKFEFLYSCLKPSESRWHFWSGASVNGILDYKLLPELGNAATTVSMFGSIAAEELVQCDFAYDKQDRSHPWMTAFFRLSLPIFTSTSRPGFSYVVDSPSEDPLKTLLAANESGFKAFPGCSTDLGFTVNLRNGNRFSFGHRWDYLTTGKKGAYRYDNTYRTYYIQFMFKI